MLSTGNLAANDRVALFLMDYPRRERLKILGHARVEDARDQPELVARMAGPEARGVVERIFHIEVLSFDWNCPNTSPPVTPPPKSRRRSRRSRPASPNSKPASRNPTHESETTAPALHEETAKIKVQLAEDAWNSRDPERVSLAYTPDTEWRNRDLFLNGRAEVVAFLEKKWSKEHDYRLKKTLWAFTGNRIAVRFEYEWHDDNGQWWRSHGNENWEFDENGYMAKRFASINDQPSPRRNENSMGAALRRVAAPESPPARRIMAHPNSAPSGLPGGGVRDG